LEKLKSNTTNVSAIYQKGLNSIPCPIPPLAEQHRIVAKVDELMGLCDQLKNSLQQVQETQILLTDAVVENAM
jgi:type I restriction enzyme S subunit